MEKKKKTILVPQEGIGYFDKDEHPSYYIATFGCHPCLGLLMFIKTLCLVFHVSHRGMWLSLGNHLGTFITRAKSKYPNDVLHVRLIGNYDGSNDYTMNCSISCIT